MRRHPVPHIPREKLPEPLRALVDAGRPLPEGVIYLAGDEPAGIRLTADLIAIVGLLGGLLMAAAQVFAPSQWKELGVDPTTPALVIAASATALVALRLWSRRRRRLGLDRPRWRSGLWLTPDTLLHVDPEKKEWCHVVPRDAIIGVERDNDRRISGGYGGPHAVMIRVLVQGSDGAPRGLFIPEHSIGDDSGRLYEKGERAPWVDELLHWKPVPYEDSYVFASASTG